MNHLFPVFLKLEELDLLIVGGGYVGLEKITGVLQNAPGAHVVLVAPEIRDEIRKMAALHLAVELVERRFEPADLEEKDAVIVATNNKDENKDRFHNAFFF